MPETLTMQPPAFVRLLAHALRWHLVKTLTWGDYRVQELVAQVNQPLNLVSYHLKQLRDDGLVSTRRSEADGRDIYYSLDLARLRSLYQAAGVALHPALSPAPPVVQVNTPPRRVLFVCTHNAARSQMAEGLLRSKAGDRAAVFSAGSHPTRLHPDAVATMDAFGIDIRAQQAKHLQEFSGQAFDYIITVCDRAREVCPTFPGEGQQFHWGFADPSAIVNAADRRHAFQQIALQLNSRIESFLLALADQ